MPLLDLLRHLIVDFDISPSDGLLLYCTLPAAAFAVIYSATSPWWNIKKFGWLGVVTVLHSLSVLMLLFLIVYAIIFGQKVDEGYRVLISATLAFALTSKLAVYLIERVRGLRERHEERVRIAGMLGRERVDGS